MKTPPQSEGVGWKEQGRGQVVKKSEVMKEQMGEKGGEDVNLPAFLETLEPCFQCPVFPSPLMIREVCFSWCKMFK